MIQPQNLLIVRTDRIGDVVLSLPLAAIIKKRFAGCRITFLLREYTKPLAENNPFIDEIITLKLSGTRLLLKENVSIIKRRQFDAAVIVYPTFMSSLIIFFSGIKRRIGTGYRWYSFLFTHKTFEHRKTAEKHELEYNLSLLAHFGIKDIQPEEKTGFNLHSEPAAEKRVSEVLKENAVKLNKKIIIIHPGSGGSAVDLPLQKFRELTSLIDENSDVNIIITGSREEFEKCRYVAGNSRAVNLAGKFDLTELIALTGMSDIFAANSTGPLHIAAALGKYTVGFYPKVPACSAKRWGPYTEKSLIFEPEIDCKDCTVEQCHKINCMNTINIRNVFENIDKILKLLPSRGETDAK